MESIKENNKMIAEFMGGKLEIQQHEVMNGSYANWPKEYFPVDYMSFDGSNVRLSYLVYERNWNLLMPVVEKIESLDYSVNICSTECDITNVSKVGWKIESGESFSKIEGVFRAVNKFINWYNKNK